MATTILNSPQASPGAGTPGTIYTVGTGKALVVSCMTICNRQGVTTSFRVWREPGGVAADANYWYYDTPLRANSTFAFVLPKTAVATDVIKVQSANGLCSF